MSRSLRGGALVTLSASLVLSGVATGTAVAKSKASAPAASAAPAAMPTATPEPPEKAIPRLEARLKAEPNDRAALTQLAGYYNGTGHPDKALELTKKLFALGDKSANTYYLDGIANAQLGHGKEAAADLEQAADLEPTNAQLLITLTELYLRMNRVADADRVAKRATVFNKTDARAWLNYGLVLAQEKKYADARQQFETAAKLEPKDADPVTLEARSYIDENQPALALQTFDRALAIDPRNPDALLGKARLLDTQHNVRAAIPIYEELITIMPDPGTKAQLIDEEARLYAAEKMPNDAEAQFKRAISQFPQVPGTHIAYGDWFASQNQMAKAEQEWTLGLGPNKNNPDALGRLGDYYLQTNQPQKAVEEFKKLTDELPNDAAGLAALGQSYALSKQFDKARDAYRRSFEIARTPAALVGLGAADYELKNYKESAAIFDAIDKNAGDFLKANPQVYFVMAKAYEATNQKGKAKAAYTKLLGFTKHGSPQEAQVKKMISDLDRSSSDAAKPPAKSAAPKKKS